jgi:hypothetical protein
VSISLSRSMGRHAASGHEFARRVEAVGSNNQAGCSCSIFGEPRPPRALVRQGAGVDSDGLRARKAGTRKCHSRSASRRRCPAVCARILPEIVWAACSPTWAPFCCLDREPVNSGAQLRRSVLALDASASKLRITDASADARPISITV